jgi:hypothetical protein
VCVGRTCICRKRSVVFFVKIVIRSYSVNFSYKVCNSILPLLFLVKSVIRLYSVNFSCKVCNTILCDLYIREACGPVPSVRPTDVGEYFHWPVALR